MLANRAIVAFVATKKPELAKAFYRDVIGLTLVEDTPFALVFDDGGTMLRVQRVKDLNLAPYTALGWNVPDIDTAVASLVAAGVVFERYSFVPQDEHGIWTTPDGSRIAWFKDPDGNTLSLAQLMAAAG
jgi:predicted enzyme related to lactoylglutathione lyase